MVSLSMALCSSPARFQMSPAHRSSSESWSLLPAGAQPDNSGQSDSRYDLVEVIGDALIRPVKPRPLAVSFDKSYRSEAGRIVWVKPIVRKLVRRCAEGALSGFLGAVLSSTVHAHHTTMDLRPALAGVSARSSSFKTTANINAYKGSVISGVLPGR